MKIVLRSVLVIVLGVGGFYWGVLFLLISIVCMFLVKLGSISMCVVMWYFSVMLLVKLFSVVVVVSWCSEIL